MATKSKEVKKGDIICYRSELGRVLKVEEDGITIRGPYMIQKIDWEDYHTYNK